MKIAGSVAVITGGASGLGRATAERLLAGGGKVALLDLPRSAGAEVAKSMGGNALLRPATSRAPTRWRRPSMPPRGSTAPSTC